MSARARRPRSGMTLIEVLIAVSLVGLLSVGMLMAMRVGLNAMDKANRWLISNRRSIGAQRILEQQVTNLLPAPADCLAAPGARPERIRFFQGEPQSMRFVSTYSLEEGHRGYPRILEFQVIPGENNQGVRLIVNEHLYTGPASTGRFCLGRLPFPRFAPIEAGPRSFVLADRLAGCRFLYRETLPPPLLENWVPVWVKPEWPSAIRVEMEPLERDDAKIPLLSATLAVRAAKNPMFAYAD